MKYRKEIDGLRALAILPVVLFHIGEHILPGGYIGVDIFFVISGYLISSILLKEHAEGRFSFQSFWSRRIRRILPILTVVVFLVLVGSLFLSYKPDVPVFGHYGISALLSYANLSHWLQAGNYWGNAAEDSPLLHTWSLSVEEQFYLVFPIILFFLIKYAKRWLLGFFSLAVFLSFALYVYGSWAHPSATFYLLPTRAWEIGLGVLVAIYLRSRSAVRQDQRYAPAVVLISVGAIGWSFWSLGATSGATQIALFVPVVATALIIAFSDGQQGRCYATRLLTLPMFVGVGKLSYSMYLWHWPLLVFWQIYWGPEFDVVDIFLFFLVVAILSYLSYRYIENVFRKTDSSIGIVLGTWVAVTVFAFSLTFVDAHEGLDRFTATVWHGELYNVNPVRTWSDHLAARMYGIDTPVPPVISPDLHREGVTRQYGSSVSDILVFGDSHGLMWSKVLDEIALELGKTITFYTADGTFPFFQIPPAIQKEGSDYFSAQQKLEFELAKYERLSVATPRLLIVLTPWGSYENPSRLGMAKPLLDLAKEKDIAVFTISQPPFLTFGDKNAPQYISFRTRGEDETSGVYLRGYDVKAMETNFKILEHLSKNYGNFHFYNLNDLFLNNDRVLVAKDRNILYIDDDHLSYAGSLLAKQPIMDRIVQALGK